MTSDDRSPDEPVDPVLDGLVERAREDREGDARWRALAEGEATADEARALADEDPERYARYRPFDADEDDALLDGALAALAGRSRARDDPDPLADPSARVDPGRLVAPLADVIRPARWRRVIYIAAPLALAAGLALVLLRPAASPALPAYSLDDTSGDRATRSATAARVVHPDARLRWVLRPAHPVQPTVDGRAFVIEGQRRIPLSLDFESAAGGALRVDAPVKQALPDRVGPVTLLIVIGPAAALDRIAADPAAFDPGAPPTDVRVVKHRLDIQSAR